MRMMRTHEKTVGDILKDHKIIWFESDLSMMLFFSFNGDSNLLFPD